jgi:hypothetical protein
MSLGLLDLVVEIVGHHALLHAVCGVFGRNERLTAVAGDEDHGGVE